MPTNNRKRGEGGCSTIGKKNIGAPKIQNNFEALKL